MAAIVTSVEIDRPAEDVFAYATDPTRFHEWQQGVVNGRLEQTGQPDCRYAMLHHPAHRWRQPGQHLGDQPHQPAEDLGRAWCRWADQGHRRPDRRTVGRAIGRG